MALILASQSPRRADLLQQLGVRFTACAASIDETPGSGEAPAGYVRRMALEKARAVVASPRDWVLAADTTVICAGEILGKPADRSSARAMLRSMSGNRHTVCTAVCLRGAERELQCAVNTAVEFCDLDDSMIDSYLATDEPWDKAGAYAIQGLGGALVRRIEGSYSNVVGLPICETRELLRRAGVPSALHRGDPP